MNEKDIKTNYHTISKENSVKSSEETGENYEKNSNSSRSSKKINPMKFAKFLNSASSFWSKKFCLKK